MTATLLDGSSQSVSTRNRFLVVNDRLRGDEELAIAILEKAVLGETVLDQVMLDQLKAYIRGGGGDAGHGENSISEVMRNLGVRDSFDGPGGDFVCDEFDNSSVDSAGSSEEGEKFEDACSDDAGQYVVEGGSSVATPQLDRIEKHIIPPQRRTLDQPDLGAATDSSQLPLSSARPQTRPVAEGVDAALQAKNKDRSVAKGRLLFPVTDTTVFINNLTYAVCAMPPIRSSCILDSLTPSCRMPSSFGLCFGELSGLL
jgi:hypothetical protein